MKKKIKTAKQIYKGAPRSYTPANSGGSGNGEAASTLNKFEPVYKNLFEVEFKFPDNVEVHPLFTEQLLDFKVNKKSSYIDVAFEENLDEDHNLITYSSLKNLMTRESGMYVKRFDLRFNAYDKTGYIFLQQDFQNAWVFRISDMKFSYRSGTKIIRYKVRITFASFTEKLV